jgi:uncharacterized NAD-dependent epimerase/dehydratase family protein
MGSQPDAFVVCHHANRTHISGWEEFELPSIQSVIDRTISIGASTNPNIRCIGLSVNTKELSESEALDYLEHLSKKFELPATDPIRFGVKSIVKALW